MQGGSGGGNGYLPIAPGSPSRDSPGFELPSVGREKYGLLGSSLGSSAGGGGSSGPLPALLSVTAASGSLRRVSSSGLGGSLGGGGGSANGGVAAVRTSSVKQKISPKASHERMDSLDFLQRQHSSADTEGGEGSSRRRHPSSTSESLL